MISILRKKNYLLLLTFLLLILALPVKAQQNNKNLVNIYFFHSNDCTHCHSEKKFLDTLEVRYNNIKIYRYEIHSEENNQIRKNVQDLYDIKTNGVPLTIIGDTPYIGYSEEKSNITFIKTIEYYSKYGYIDQVGNLLKIQSKPTYKVSSTNPTLEDFLNTYGNYKLIGSIYTDNLDLSSNAIIIGILSQFNIIKLITTIIVLTLLIKIKENSKSSIIMLAIYIITSLLLNTTYIFSNWIYTLIISTIILSILIIGLIRNIRTKEKKHLYNIILIFLSIASSYIENYLHLTHAKVFNEIIKLHSLTGLNKISFYGNYLFIIFAINLSLFLLIIFYITKDKQDLKTISSKNKKRIIRKKTHII